MCASGGSARSVWRLQPTDVWRVLYHSGLIDRRTFLLTPLALACAADRPPNLLLITATGWRGMATPWDGDPDLIAPHLKNFGEQSVVFSRTYCASPKPELAQTALLTSKFPHAAKAGDVTFLQGRKYTPDAAAKVFEKTPFALRIELPGPSEITIPHASSLHPRGNVPSDEEAWARNRLARFYANCRGVDEELGEILAALDKVNLAQDTVVAFTSDCGQQLGSQGLDGAEVPFEESVRIPLAIRYPRKLKPEARDLASQVDIMPTLMTLCGMEIPDSVQGQDLFGATPPEVAFSEGKFGEADEWRLMVRGYDKIVATPKGEITHLFNLADDPYETTDLASDPAQKLKIASLKAQLQAQMKKLGDGMDPSGLRKR
jgi:arylsulfatase A-like enzyme